MDTDAPSPCGPARRPPRVALLTNMPAPYRVPVYDLVPGLLGGQLDCIYATEREPNRDWRVDLPGNDSSSGGARHHFLSARQVRVGERFIHFSVGVTALLRRLAPDVIVTTAYSQPYLQAFGHALRHGLPHIPFTDGTVESERTLGAVHRFVRRVVLRRSAAFVGASQGSLRLFASYGIAREHCFQSHLCADMARYQEPPPGFDERPVDIVFSGRLHPVKQPDFVLDVARGVARRLGRGVHVEILGSGPMREALETRAETLRADGVQVRFAGFLSQDALPAAYRRARVMLFPTRWDPWGVVANEALAAGTPVIASPAAGASGEIVLDGRTGRVLPLVLDDWIDATATLVAQPAPWQACSTAAREIVAPYHYRHAAQGLADAVRHALRPTGASSS